MQYRFIKNFQFNRSIFQTGLLSGMPHIFRMLWAFIFSQLGDYLLRSNKMNRTNVRKLATAVSKYTKPHTLTLFPRTSNNICDDPFQK